MAGGGELDQGVMKSYEVERGCVRGEEVREKFSLSLLYITDMHHRI